jgi:predicted enzyme related to lactoylglutathione lyase
MSESPKPAVGSITWTDLTVDDAETVRDFYRSVVGWKPFGVDMGGYEDFTMLTDGEEPVCGICHARGTNAGLPAQWLVYITVADVDASARLCEEQGGKVIVAPKQMGAHGRYCVIQDPAGAVAALFTPADEA